MSKYEVRYVGDWISYIYDNETKEAVRISNEDFVRLLNKQEQKIADLEAKLTKNKKWLASNEGFLENQKIKQQLDESNESHHKNIVELTKMATEKDRKIEELKQQLFESGLKTLEEIKLSEQRKKMLEDLSTKNWELEQQLAEKEKELLEIKQRIAEKASKEFQEMIDKRENHNQDKISFALEQLERLKKLCQEKFNWWENSELEGDIYDKSDVSNAYFDIEANIDNQIEELKKGVE